MGFSLAIVFSQSDDLAELKACLRSCFDHQTQKPDELLLVLNGLDELTSQALKSYVGKYPVQFLENEKSRPLSDGLNDAISIASFDYVARIDPDDVCRPERFEKQIAFMEANPNIDILGCAVKKGPKIKSYPQSHESIARAMRLANVIAHPSVMGKKSALMFDGGYPAVKKSQDYLLWLRLLKSGHVFATLPEVLVDLGQDGLAVRRGMKYFRSEVSVLSFAARESLIPIRYIFLNLAVRFVLRSMPLPLRRLLYGT